MHSRVGLATYEHAPLLAPDDQALIPALHNIGIDAHPVIWSDEAASWPASDAVIIRSCWDYHLRPDAFLRWLAVLESSGVPVLNPPPLVRWNADKRYLLDLARRGVATIPTMVVHRGHADDVARVATAEGWSRFVLKPTVSASGHETYALTAPLDSTAREIIRRVTSHGDTLLQPFADEIARDGEYSFTFLDGAFSHATIKRAARGEFRVQTEHGGTVSAVEASQSAIDQAARAIHALPEQPLYARVDGILRDGAFLLMELELIEPNLFLAYGDGAVDRLAEAIRARITKV